MNWAALKAEGHIPPCPNVARPGVRAYRPTAGAIHRAATRAALLRRHVYPGSEAWKDFFPRRKADWCDVSVADLKAVLARPDRYAPTYGADVREVMGRHIRFRDPTGPGLNRHHVNKINEGYGTLISGTGGITSLASSSTWLAGYEWYLVDNTAAADAGLQLDWFHSGQAMTGTTPTASTEIRHYLVGSPDGTFWPDVFDGTPSAETVTSAGVASGFLKLPPGGVCQVDATTSNLAYPYAFAARAAFQGVLPKKWVHFVTHNSGAALNSTAGNHSYYAQPEYVTFT